MVTIYRFENDKGKGPFVTDACTAYDKNHGQDYNHTCSDMPSPTCGAERGTDMYEAHRENGYSDEHSSLKQYVYGFMSLHQLKVGFPYAEGRKAMEETGQKLVIYEVPESHTIQGTYQVMFLPQHAECIGYLDMFTLEPIG